MAVGQPSPLLRYIRRLACSAAGNGPTDGQLLERYVVDGHNAAFGVLVKRHGPMVHGVCRRILGNVHDADDALQAVFLVLMRSAHKIANTECIGSWLYGVAYRTALRAKRSAGRRRNAERNAPAAGFAGYESESVWTELRPVLDQEIARLPEKWRLPFVLCYLEGKTNAEAAHQLRWPLGTVATRLARARDRLRKRLTSRGAGLSAGTLLVGEVRTEFAAGACKRLGASQMDAVLEGASSKWAVSLAKGVVTAMWITKTSVFLTVVLATAVTAGGVGMVLTGAFGADGAPTTQGPRLPFAAPAAGQTAVPEGRVLQNGEHASPKKPKELQIQCVIMEVNKDGGAKSLAQPIITTLEGRQAEFVSCGQIPVNVDIDGKTGVDFLPVGTTLSFIVFTNKDGRLRVDSSFNQTEAQAQEEENVTLKSVGARSVRVANFGEVIDYEVEKGGTDGGRYRIVFTVTEVGSRPEGWVYPNPVPDTGK